MELLKSRLLYPCKVSLEEESGGSEKAKHGSRWGKLRRAVVNVVGRAVVLRPRHDNKLIGKDFEIGGRVVGKEEFVVSQDSRILVVD